ncbi:MAG: hypothetical protein AAFN51_09385, partial [Pseudomonadota bacterium]
SGIGRAVATFSAGQLAYSSGILPLSSTARAYCDRIVAMRKGRVMFDGTAAQLTDDVVRDIYGLEGLREFNEAVTSTSVKVPA